VPHKHLHSSGRYDRTYQQAEAALTAYMTVHDADVITLTEQGNARHRAVIAEMADKYGYTAHQGPGKYDDCVVLLRKTRFRALRTWHDELSPLPQNRATGGPKHHSITVLAQDMTGRLVIYTAAHLTAGVEAGWAAQGYRVRLWLAAQSRWATQTAILRRRYKAKVVMVADWNLNIKKPVYRALLHALHPRLTLTWKSPFPAGGTHGTRIIDATLTNLLVLHNAYLLHDDDSSDHRPYAETLA
jgi:hypothetical protein